MKLASSALDFYTNTNSLPASYNPFFYLFRVAARSFPGKWRDGYTTGAVSTSWCTGQNHPRYM